MPSPLHDLGGFRRCLVGPELQKHAEVHPCLLGLSADTFFLVDRISGVFRDGELYLLAHYEGPPYVTFIERFIHFLASGFMNPCPYFSSDRHD